MNGIISEIITTLDYADEVSNERDTYFRAFIGGKAIEEMDYFVDNNMSSINYNHQLFEM